MLIKTNDVVIRYLRFRRGPGALNKNGDGIELLTGASNVVIDHNSLTWGVDGTLDSYGEAQNFTYSWNIIAETLEESTSLRDDGTCCEAHSKANLVGDIGSPGNIIDTPQSLCSQPF